MEPATISSALVLAAADGSRRLTAVEFRGLEEVPPEVEWFNNLSNPCTRRAYQGDIREFMAFIGIVAAGEVRKVTRSHVLAWRRELEGRGLAGSTIRRKLSAVASLFDHLCESNAVTHNPLWGVQRPKANAGEGKTRPSAMARPARCLTVQTPEPSKVSATEPSSPCCSTTA